MTLGERIKNCRQNAGLSQEKVAELVGVSRQAVTKWETDKSAPSTENLFKLAEIFGTTVDMILKDDKEVPKTDWKQRFKGAGFVIFAYFLFYLAGRILWVPIKNMTVIGWFVTSSPYHIEEYLYGWLFDKHFIVYGMLIGVAFSLCGKQRAAYISYAGFVAGYILGLIFGPNPEGALAGQGHYGWAVWGISYLLSIIGGMIVERMNERGKKLKNN